jgi:predicted RNase H-like HicB family nuclease
MERVVNAIELLSSGYARRLTPNPDGGYTASIQEFPGVVAEGATADEALQNLENAAHSWIEAVRSSGQRVPEPVDLGSYSGKVALRLPRGLHKRAAEMASSEGVSLNQWFVSAIGHYLGSRETLNAAVDQMCSRIMRSSRASTATMFVYDTTINVMAPAVSDQMVSALVGHGVIPLNSQAVFDRGNAWPTPLNTFSTIKS